MQPYYQDDWATIYCGDCKKILPSLDPNLVYVTDQPYGTGWARGGGRVGEFNAAHYQPSWDIGDLEWIDKLQSPKRIASFCPKSRCKEFKNKFASASLLYYRKTNVSLGGNDKEPIVVSPALPVEFEKTPTMAILNFIHVKSH